MSLRLQMAPGVTQHTVVLCVEKQERGIATQTVLAQAGYKVVIATSMYDALKQIPQEMPHVVISEALLSDGSAGNLYDKLQADLLLAKIPVMLHVIKKTKDELAVASNRAFAGFFLGPFEPKNFLAKLKEVVDKHSPVSPFFYSMEECGVNPDMSLVLDGMMIGKSGDQIVCRSASEVDPAAALVCVPAQKELGPVVLKMGSNLKSGDAFYNLFPLARAIGKGRVWLEKLADLDPNNMEGGGDGGTTLSATQQVSRKVIFMDPNEQRANGFKDVLAGYGIELVYAKTISAATAMMKREPESFGGIYLHELMNDPSGIDWKTSHAKLPSTQKPPAVIGTTSSNLKSTESIRYLKKPFGMGVLVEMMEALFQRASTIAGAVQSAAGNAKSVAVLLQTPAKLIGLDETGGVIQLKSPVARGARLTLQHEFVSKLLGDNTVTVTHVATVPGKGDAFQARFSSIGPGLSKSKYWEKISKTLAAEAEKKKAQDELIQALPPESDVAA